MGGASVASIAIGVATTAGASSDCVAGAVADGRPMQAQSVALPGAGVPRVPAAAEVAQQLWSARIGATPSTAVVAGEASSAMVTQCADATGSTSVKASASTCRRNVGRRVRIVPEVSTASRPGASRELRTAAVLTQA